MLKRGLSLFLSIVMVLSLMPLQTFAADDVTEPAGTEPEATEPEETEPESGITTYPTREDGIPQEGSAYYVQVKPETFTRTEANQKVVTDEMGHTHYEISAETHETERMTRAI